MADLNLTPHPLVAEIAARLLGLEEPLAMARDVKSANAPDEGGAPRDDQAAIDRASGYARQLAAASGLSETVTFSGYLGATVPKNPTGTNADSDLKNLSGKWSVLYLDTRLLNWLLVQADAIVFRDPVKDEQAPFAQRDVLWVKADAAVGRGGGSMSVEAQFLTGDWTRAGDFDDAPLGGGTLAASTGVFCEARSVGCCRPRTPAKP